MLSPLIPLCPRYYFLAEEILTALYSNFGSWTNCLVYVKGTSAFRQYGCVCDDAKYNSHPTPKPLIRFTKQVTACSMEMLVITFEYFEKRPEGENEEREACIWIYAAWTYHKILSRSVKLYLFLSNSHFWDQYRSVSPVVTVITATFTYIRILNLP